MRPRSTGSLVVALGLASLLVSQAVCFLVIWTLPRPSPPLMDFAEAIAVLQDEAPPGRYGMLAWRQPYPPEGRVDGAMSLMVATLLDLSGEDIRVLWVRPETAPMVRVLRAHEQPGEDQDEARRVRDMLLRGGLRWPAFQLARREADGGWRVVTVAHDDTWRRQVLLALGAGLVVLAPLVAWAALRINRPIRRLAEAGEALELREGPPLPESGPREVRMLARAMNSAHARLRAQAEGTARMLAAVAHDLRTPLTGLRLRAETAPPDQAARMVEDIERMGHMIEQVLDFARGEFAPARPEPMDLRELLRDWARQARERGLPVEDEIPALPPFAGDASLLRRAVDNLVENAARYAGAAELRARGDDDSISIEVADRGPGIAGDDKLRLLQPFERHERSRNRATGGAGLGLAVAVGAARAHGGELVLLDRQGGGLVARLRLPLRPARGDLGPPGFEPGTKGL